MLRDGVKMLAENARRNKRATAGYLLSYLDIYNEERPGTLKQQVVKIRWPKISTHNLISP